MKLLLCVFCVLAFVLMPFSMLLVMLTLMLLQPFSFFLLFKLFFLFCSFLFLHCNSVSPVHPNKVVFLLVVFNNASLGHAVFVYSGEQLTALIPAGIVTRPADIPPELWRKTHLGCRVGKQRQRMRGGLRGDGLMERGRFNRVSPLL